jgi:ribonuclease VapC
MFMDASAIVAILMRETGWELLESKADEVKRKLTSALAVYEAVLGVARKLSCGMDEAQAAVNGFLREASASTVTIDEAIGTEAISAHARFGKGRHRASLNMGDCFAYACAKVHRVPLLCRGDDFVHTDITIA